MSTNQEVQVPGPPSLGPRKRSLGTWSFLDAFLLVGTAAGLVTAILCGALVYRQYLDEKSWEKADKCYIQAIDMVPRALAEEVEMDPAVNTLPLIRKKRQATWPWGGKDHDSHERSREHHGGMFPHSREHGGGMFPHGISPHRPGRIFGRSHHGKHPKGPMPHPPMPGINPEEPESIHGEVMGFLQRALGHIAGEDDDWITELTMEEAGMVEGLEEKFKGMLGHAMEWLAELKEAHDMSDEMDSSEEESSSEEQEHSEEEEESSVESSEESSEERGSSEESSRSHESDRSDDDEPRFGKLTDSGSSEEDDDDEECELMPCWRVMVSYQKNKRIGQGYLHPSIESQEEMPVCLASPCTKDLHEMRDELRRTVGPYVHAYMAKEEVQCFCEDPEEEEHGLLWNMGRDLKDTIEGWCGTEAPEDDDEEDDDDEEGSHEEHDDRRKKRQAFNGMPTEHLVADKKYKSPLTYLSVTIPALFSVLCFLAFLIRCCVMCCKSQKTSKRAEPYGVSRGPSFIGKSMRTPSVWSLGSAWEEKGKKMDDNVSLPPSYNFIITQAPAYDDAMKQAPPSYHFVQQTAGEETKVDLSKETTKAPEAWEETPEEKKTPVA